MSRPAYPHSWANTRNTVLIYNNKKGTCQRSQEPHGALLYENTEGCASSVSRTICHAASAEDINNDIEPVSRRKMQGSDAWPILHL